LLGPFSTVALQAGDLVFVMGDGYEHLSAAQRQEVLAAFPRTGFKDNILQTFFGGFAYKPKTTFGNIKADVADRLLVSVQGKTNFFKKRVGDYQKAGVMSTRAANTFSLDKAF
jgi:hypothetical protein